MTSSGVPNKDRAEGALSVYRDAMRQYIAPILEEEYGLEWFISQVLTKEARKPNQKRHQQLRQSLLLDGTPPQDLIDVADIPYLIQNNRHSFNDLRRADIERMDSIRSLRNELNHTGHAGDCTPSYADAVVGLCGLVLERCDLLDAVERIRRLSPMEPARRVGTTAEALSEERRRRHPELEERERAETEGLHGALDEARANQALLIFRKAMRRHIGSVLQRAYGLTWLLQVYGDDAPGVNRHRRVRLLHELDRGVPPWQLIDVSDFPFLVRNDQQLFPDLGPADIDRMVSITSLRNRLAHSHDRTPGEDDEIVDLCSLVLERCGLQYEAEDVRRLSLPAFDDDDGLRRWFDADEGRQQRHPSEYVALERREQKQHRSLFSRILRRG